MKQRFFYCPKCGGKLSYRNCGERNRLVCGNCSYIFYENPIVGVAAVVLDQQGRLLLGRRNSSYKGLWCIPCGYVEYDEDVYEAIIREFKEETNLTSKSPVSVRCSPTSTILKRIPWESGLKLKLPAVSSQPGKTWIK